MIHVRSKSKHRPSHAAAWLSIFVAGVAQAEPIFDRETTVFRCGEKGRAICTEVSEISTLSGGDRLVVSVTDFVFDRPSKSATVKQRLILAAPPEKAELKLKVGFTAVQDRSYPLVVLTHFGPQSSYPAGIVPTNSGGISSDLINQSARAASELRTRAIQAYDNGTRIVDTQTAQTQSSRRLADDWASGAVGRSNTALAELLADLARLSSTSGMPAEAAIDSVLRQRVPEYVMPSTTRLEGKAAQRNLAALSDSISRGNFKAVLDRVRALRGSAAADPTVAAGLATVTRPDGTLDLAKAVVGLEPSPFSIGSIPKATPFRNRDAVVAMANEYEVLWADSNAIRSLGDSDRLAFLIGTAYVRAAADAGSVGLSQRSDEYLRVAAAQEDQIRGFTVGMVQGLIDTAKLVPELAQAASDIAEAYFTSPERQRAALAGLAVAIPKIPALVRTALVRSYGKWLKADSFERSRILGRITFEVLIAVATGEALEYAKAAAAPAELAKLSLEPIRK